MKNLLVFLFFNFCFICHVDSQMSTTIVVDRTIYVNGDVLRGVILFENVKVDDKVLRINVFNQTDSNDIIQSFYVKIVNNIGSFYFPISSDVLVGNYKMEFETISLTSFIDHHFLGYSFFTIVDHQKNSQLSIKRKKVSSNIINSDEKILKLSDKRSIDLSSLFTEKLKMIAIVDTSDDVSLNTFNFPTWGQNFVDGWSNKIFATMNFRNENDLKKFNLLGLYSSLANKTFVSKSNDNGDAIFLLDDFESSHFFQILFSMDETSSIEFNQQIKKHYLDPPLLEMVSNEQLSSIKNRFEARNYFGISQFSIDSIAKTKYYGNIQPQKVYKVSDFKKFPDFKTFCLENSLPIKFINTGCKSTIVIKPSAYYTKQFESSWDHPLIMVNNEVIKDYKSLMDMPMSEIESISLFFDTKTIRKHFSAFGNNGLIQIALDKKAKWNIRRPYSFKINGFQPHIKDVNDIVSWSKQNHLPFFCPTNLWHAYPGKSEDLLFDLNASRIPKIVYCIVIDKTNKLQFLRFLSD